MQAVFRKLYKNWLLYSEILERMPTTNVAQAYPTRAPIELEK